MGWKLDSLDMRRPAVYSESEPSALAANKSCFIRKHHSCGKLFGASKSCFIASPNEDDLEPLLALASEKLMRAGIEPVIAVKERAYGQDIFCTKICGRIIESQFCIAILDDAMTGGVNIPNPNVYYEYGLMTALRKHIIPLQQETLRLAFNIQSYDTIKYNSKNLSSELDKAIAEAAKTTEPGRSGRHESQGVSERTVLRNLELAGYFAADRDAPIASAVRDTGFRAFYSNEHPSVLLLAKVDTKAEVVGFLEDLAVVVPRVEAAHLQIRGEHDRVSQAYDREAAAVAERQRLGRELPRYIDAEVRLQQSRDFHEAWLQMLSTTFVGAIVSTEADLSTVKDKAQSILAKAGSGRFSLTISEQDLLVLGEQKVSFVSVAQ